MQAILDEPLADVPDGALARVQRGGDLPVPRAFLGMQENLRPIDRLHPHRATMDVCMQVVPLVISQMYHRGFLPLRRLLRDAVRLAPSEENR